MAYGDLKVRNLIWNTGSGDNTVVLNTLATTSSPTFTGTVTVPTATAGDNSTKAASTAFVVASFAPKASPAFTGNATGVNLTLSGNLTVNGTTTTIDTTTLQVEDKNIEIGKVSSPSDTTADGGGWSLLGSTTKTFNWVNATDAWTSSEHIHLGDNKKLLLGTGSDLEISHDGSINIINAATSNAISFRRGGTEQFFIGDSEFKGGDNQKIKLGTGDDLQIYHDGTDTILKNVTGELQIRGDTLVLAAASAYEKYLKGVKDGAVELFYDAVKTFETKSNGVIVQGTEGQNAELLLYADEGDDDADKWRIKSDTAGSFEISNYASGGYEKNIECNGNGNVELYFNNSKKIETTNTGVDVTGEITVNGSALSSAPQITATASGAITAGKPVIVNANGTVTQVASSFSLATTPTASSGVEIEANHLRMARACYDTTNDKIILIYDTEQTVRSKCVVGTCNGTTITWGTPVQIDSDPFSKQFEIVFDKSINKAVAFCDNGTDGAYGVVISVSGTTPSFGTKAVLTTGTATDGFAYYDDSASKIVVGYRDGDNSDKTVVRTCTASGTTLSYGTAVDLESSGTCPFAVGAYDSNSNKGLVAYQHSSSTKAKVVSVSGTTVSIGSSATITSPASTTMCLVFDPNVNKFALTFRDDTNDDYCGIVGVISGTSSSWGSRDVITTNSANPSDHLRNTFYDSTLNRIVAVYRDSSTSDDRGMLKSVTISSGSSTFSPTFASTTAFTWSTEETLTECSIYDPDQKVGIMVYQNHSQSENGYSRAVDFKTTSTNVTAENYIGVAAASASDSASATIDVSGATNASQSSLTPGQKYYVQNNGTLGLTAATPNVFAGTAVSATKIIVNDQAPAPAVLWEVLSTHNFAATNASEVIQRGWTNANYSQFKLVWADLSGGANNVYRTIRLRFYISGSDSAQGSEYSDGSYYKSFRQKGSYTGTGLSGNNRSDTEWRLNNDSGMRWGSGEIVFPATTYNGGGYRPIHAYGRVCSEDGSDFCGCELAHPISSSSFLNGVKVYSNGNWTTGRMTWYGLRNN